LVHYVVVRTDLPAGVAAAQLVHAAGESSPGNLGAGTFAVVLAVPDEAALMKVADRLRAAGMPFTLIFESDAPWSGQLMAIGARPACRSVMRKVLSSIPLYRGPAAGVSDLGGVAQR
jgi:peptidyl-tRNA hydrolase